MSNCKYCGKECDGEFCDEQCSRDMDDFLAKTKRFSPIIQGLLIIVLVALVVSLALHTPTLIGAAFVIEGIFVIALPYFKVPANRDARKHMLYNRISGVICAALGVAVVILQIGA